MNIRRLSPKVANNWFDRTHSRSGRRSMRCSYNVIKPLNRYRVFISVSIGTKSIKNLPKNAGVIIENVSGCFFLNTVYKIYVHYTIILALGVMILVRFYSEIS